MASKLTPDRVEGISTFTTWDSNDHFSVVHAEFVPTYSVNVNFAFTVTLGGAVYFSDQPLKGNPDDDKDHLIIQTDKNVQSPWNGPQSKDISLIKGKRYYVIFIYNACFKDKKGGDLKYKKVGDHFSSYRSLNSEWFTIPGTTDEMIRESQWKPELVPLQGLEKWRGNNLVLEDNSHWKVLKHPPGKLYRNNRYGQGTECGNCNINKVLFGGDYSTEFRVNWWTNIGIVAFPHDFIIDLGKPTRFSFIKLTGSGNQDYCSMNSSIEIRLADSRDNLSKTESLIYKGRYISNADDNLIHLDKAVEGSFMSIRVLNNSFRWKDNYAGSTDFSGIDVGNKVIYANKMRMLK